MSYFPYISDDKMAPTHRQRIEKLEAQVDELRTLLNALLSKYQVVPITDLLLPKPPSDTL